MRRLRILVSLLVTGTLVGSSTTTFASAEENFYLPEYGTLAEHNEWSTKAISIDKVAELGARGAGVKIAVLDSGIALNTPGINSKLHAFKDFLPSQQPLPDHGTQTASVISSEYDATTGLRGVAPDAQLIVGRVCYMSSCDSVAIRKGITWAIEQGAQIISLSIGGATDPMLNAVITSTVSQGVLVVSAAGNNGCQAIAPWGMNRFCRQGVISEQYSASYTLPGLISAGAIDQTRARANFSSWGPNVDIMAPGVNNITYDPAGATNGFGGTSAATPLIAGVAALVLSINPNLTPEQVQAILQSTTSPALERKPKVWDYCHQSPDTNVWTCDNQVENDYPQEYFTGAGIVDALAAVKMTQQITAGNLLPAPSVSVEGVDLTVNWAGGPADLYSNNKLVEANATSGFEIIGGHSQSYSVQIRRGENTSEPKLVVLQNTTTPSAPVVTGFYARAHELGITTSDLANELDQLESTFDEIGGVFELQNGKQFPCKGYSPSPPDVEKVYSFKCPTQNLIAPIQGSFRLLNKYSRLGPGTPVSINTLLQSTPTLQVSSTYISTDEIHFDWPDVEGAQSYAYRHLSSTADKLCTTDTFFSVKGKLSQPSIFELQARSGENCEGITIAESETLPYVLLSPRPNKPTGITVQNNELTFVQFDIPNALPTDQWRIYRSDGAMVRIPAGQRIAMGMQPNENVNGKTFSYRILQVISDTYGEVWSELSDPILVAIKDLGAPSKTNCKISNSRGAVSCAITPNHVVAETLVEFLDFHGDILSSQRLNNVSDSNSLIPVLEAKFPLAASYVRVSAITGQPNEWMRRGTSRTAKVQNSAIGLAFISR